MVPRSPILCSALEPAPDPRALATGHVEVEREAPVAGPCRGEPLAHADLPRRVRQHSPDMRRAREAAAEYRHAVARPEFRAASFPRLILIDAEAPAPAPAWQGRRKRLGLPCLLCTSRATFPMTDAKRFRQETADAR